MYFLKLKKTICTEIGLTSHTLPANTNKFLQATLFALYIRMFDAQDSIIQNLELNEKTKLYMVI